MARCSALDKIYLLLTRYLNVGSIKPYLKQGKLLTDEELEQLDFACKQTSQSAAETLVKIVKRKGPSHEVDFLSALKASMKFDPHQGHVAIIAALEEALVHPELALTVDESDEDTVEVDFCNGVKSVATESDSHKRAALRSKIVKANNDIKMKFAKLVLDVYRLLSMKKVAVEEIRLSLLYLGCFKNKTESKSEQYSVISPASGLSHTKSVQSLIACLHQYSSWYNYGLIKFVATEFGGEEGILIIDNYMKNLTSYCEKIVACQCPEFSLANGLPPGYDQLIVKVDWDHLSQTAQDIAIFQAELSSLLNLEPEVFILRGIEEGCILITWAVPQAITTHIVVESMRCQQQLAKLNVLSIIAAGKYIDVKKPNKVEEHTELWPAPSAKVSDTTSQTSFLSDCTDGSPIDTPLIILPEYDISTMTVDELEIVSTYSGRSRGSMYSTGSQIFSSGSIDLVKTKQFHSECDILSPQPLQVKTIRSNSLPRDDVSTKTPSRKQRAKKFKFSLPKLLKVRNVYKAEKSSTDCESNKKVELKCDEISSAFPILDLSEEPAIKTEGNRVYSHYYCGNNNKATAVAYHATDSSATMSPLTKRKAEVKKVSYENLKCDATLTAQSGYTDGTGPYSSRESDIGSQNLPNMTSQDSLQLYSSVHVQSMKCRCSSDLSSSQKNGRLSLHKLSQNIDPSLQVSPQASCERVDTPSSGYDGSHSGCSMQSSLYSLGSVYCNVALDGPTGSDFFYHHENAHRCGYSSLKRNSTTASGRQSEEPKKSVRSHSFNGRFNVHRESIQ